MPAGPCEQSAVGLGAVWTATCTTPGLAGIDPSTNRQTGHARLVVPCYLGGEARVGVGVGAVWLVVDARDCFACRLARVDPRSLRVTAHIPVMEGAAGVRLSGRSVWVTNPDSDVVQRVDARRNASCGRPRPARGSERLLARVDQRDGQVAERYGAPAGDGAVAVGFGAVWISAPGIETVWRLPLQRVPREAPRT